MLFSIPLLFFVSTSYALTVYDVVPSHYSYNNREIGIDITPTDCFNQCDSDPNCPALFTITGPRSYCYQNTQGYTDLQAYDNPSYTLSSYLKRSDPSIPYPNLPAGSSACNSNTCLTACTSPSYFDNIGVCQPACDTSNGCSLNAAGNGCICQGSATTVTSTQIVPYTSTQINTFATQTLNFFETTLSTSIFPTTTTTQYVTPTTMANPITQFVTEIGTYTPAPTAIATSTISQVIGAPSCTVYELSFPSNCCPSNYLDLTAIIPARRFRREIVTVHPTVVVATTTISTVIATSTTDLPIPISSQTSTSTKEIDITPTETVYSTLMPVTPTVTSTLTYYSILDAPIATTTITEYSAPTACVTLTVAAQSACPRPSNVARNQKKETAKINQFKSLGSVVIDCGIAGRFNY